MAKTTRSGEPVSIEESLNRIEAAVNALESGELELEEALARYEEGLNGVRQARARLDCFAARLEELRGEDAVDDSA